MTTGATDVYSVEFEGVDAGLIASLEQIQGSFQTLTGHVKEFKAEAAAASAQATGLGKVTAVASTAGGAFARNWKTIGLSVIGVAIGVSRLVGAYKTLMSVKDRLTKGNVKAVDGKGGLKDTTAATEQATKAVKENTKEVKENAKETQQQRVQLVAAKKSYLDYALAAMTAYRTYRLFRDAMGNRKALAAATAGTGGLTSKVAGLSIGLGTVAASAGAAFAAVTKFGGSQKALKDVSKEFDKVRGTLQATLRASGAFDVVLKMLSEGFADVSKWVSANSKEIQAWTIKGVRLALKGTEQLLRGFLFLLNGAKNFSAYWTISVEGFKWGTAQMVGALASFGERGEALFGGVIGRVKDVVDSLFEGARAALELAPDALGLVDKLDAAQDKFNGVLDGGAAIMRLYVGQARTWADTMGAEAERGIRGAMGAVAKAEAEHAGRVKALEDRFAKAYKRLDEAAAKTSNVRVQGTSKGPGPDKAEAAHAAKMLELETAILKAEEERRYADRGDLEAQMTLLAAQREVEKLGKNKATLAQRQAVLAKAQVEAQAQLQAGQEQQLERERSILAARQRLAEVQFQLDGMGSAELGRAMELRSIERERADLQAQSLEAHEQEAALAELELRSARVEYEQRQDAERAARAMLRIREMASLVGVKDAAHTAKMLELEHKRRELAAAVMSDAERTVALAELELEKRRAINDEEERQNNLRAERINSALSEVTSLQGSIMGLSGALADNDMARLQSLQAQAEQAAAAEGATQAQRDAAVAAARDVERAERKKEKALKTTAFINGLVEAAQAIKASAEGIMGNPAALIAAGKHALASAQFFVAASAPGSTGGGGGGAGASSGSTGSSALSARAQEEDRRKQQDEAAAAIAKALTDANTSQANRAINITLNNPTLLAEAPEVSRQLTEQLVPQLRSALQEGRR